jgi:L-tyrosine isonitrile synthase
MLETLSHRIYEVLLRYSRLPLILIAEYEKTLVQRRVACWLASGDPLTLVVPAFPHKSPNHRDKVFGPLPDGGEEAAIITLGNLCRDISNISCRPCHLFICSDGFAFNDILGVDDTEVSSYRHEMRELINNKGLSDTIFWYEWRPTLDNSTRRTLLIDNYGRTLDVVKKETLVASSAKYTALKKFLSGDLTRLANETTGAFSRRCSSVAAHVLQRSEAHGRLVRAEFPDALRLSIHPHTRGLAEKFPVKLISGANEAWATPWHNVLVHFTNTSMTLMKRSVAESCGYHPVMHHGRLWRFDA